MFHYIDDVLSANNYRFGDFVDHIYPIELEIKDPTDTDRSGSYLGLHLKIDSEHVIWPPDIALINYLLWPPVDVSIS